MPVVEKRFEYKGYPCVVLMQNMGHRTAYVGLPKGNKYYKKSDGEIPISCHGGITYADDYLFRQADSNTWWIGFDAAHCYDAPDFESAKQLFKDDWPVLASLKKYEEVVKATHTIIFEDTYRLHIWSLSDMEQECKNIVEQLEKEG